MAQVTWGHCVQLKQRPDLTPPDLGGYTVDARPMCISNGELAPRRADVGGPRWGRGGVPTQDMCAGGDNLLGIAAEERRPLQNIATEEGPIALPYGPGGVLYMPSVRTLQSVFSIDSRRTAISDRYYR